MKRKIWIALVVAAIVIGVIWAPLPPGPSIRFLGYSKAGDDVIAQFEFANPTSRDLTFYSSTPSRPFCDFNCLVDGAWKRFNYRWEPGTNAYAEEWYSTRQILSAHKSIKFDVDVVFPVEFQVGVELAHFDTTPHAPVFSDHVRNCIASTFGRDIMRRITWSEVVSPPPP